MCDTGCCSDDLAEGLRQSARGEVVYLGSFDDDAYTRDDAAGDQADECPDCGRDNCRCHYDPDSFRDQEIAWGMEMNR